MSQTVKATYDGAVFRPDTPPDLKPNTRCLITIAELHSEVTETAWDVLERLAGSIDGPPDWSEQHDHYLYGTTKSHSGDGPASDD